jgi:ABC-type polysaccharide/polyol phosphate export permease
MLAGVLCTRYRDLPPVISSLLQIAFFLSPIMYRPSSLPAKLSFVADVNPVFYLVETVRAPLLGEVPSPYGYAVLATLAVVGWIVTFRLFQVARSRVPYWV